MFRGCATRSPTWVCCATHSHSLCRRSGPFCTPWTNCGISTECRGRPDSTTWCSWSSHIRPHLIGWQAFVDTSFTPLTYTVYVIRKSKPDCPAQNQSQRRRHRGTPAVRGFAPRRRDRHRTYSQNVSVRRPSRIAAIR